jgi:acetoin utilization deacetylase AcuC-like enzyme
VIGAMIVIDSPGHAAHDPDRLAPMADGVVYWERPARAETLLETVRRLGHSVVGPPDHGMAPIAAVHDGGYLDFLSSAYQRWKAAALPGDVVRPTSFAVRHLTHRPNVIQGQAGYYLASHSAPLVKRTWSAALVAAHAAVEAADRLHGGEREVYAICRPPGHHAYRDLAGGFCYLNNVAIAAQRLIDHGVGPLAILDIDVHHGNGTQSIFYERDDVRFVSVHSDPAELYPYFAGYTDETGAGKGLGCNVNLPLKAGTGDDGFAAAVERGVGAVARGNPAALLVSLGFDAYQGDPTANLAVTTGAFAIAGGLIGGLRVPTVLVQEGGYVVDRLADNLTAFLGGFFAARA